MSAAGTPFASSRWTSMDSSVVLPACRAPVTTTTYGLSIQPTSVSSSRRGSHECSYGRPVRHGLRMLKISMFIADTPSTWCKHTMVRPNDKGPRHLGRLNDEPSRHLVKCGPTYPVGADMGLIWGQLVIRLPGVKYSWSGLFSRLRWFFYLFFVLSMSGSFRVLLLSSVLFVFHFLLDLS